MPDEESKAARVKERRRDWLMRQPGVRGVEVDLDHAGLPCLRIVTHEMSAETRREILAKLRGTPVLFCDSGAAWPTNGSAGDHARNGRAPHRP